MTPLFLFLLGCALAFLGCIEAAFSTLMRLSLRLMAERGGRSDRLGQYLDEPLTLLEADLLKRVAPIAGGQPRAIKRLLNLYRLARPVVGERPPFALALAAEIGGWADPTAANAAVAEGRGSDQFDPRLLSAVRAARAASPSGALDAADLAAARRLARRFVAPGA